MALHLGLFPIVRTGRPDHSCPAMMRNSLLIRTIQLDPPPPPPLGTKERLFQQKRFEKAFFIVKMTCLAIVSALSLALKQRL